MALIATQDRAALQEMYVGYHPRLRRFLTYMTQRADLVEEMIGDIWITVWQAAREYRCEMRVCAWISTLALRRGFLAQLDPGPAKRHLEPADPLARALRALAIEERALFALTYCFECSCEEIASALHCSVGSIKSRMLVLRRRLQAPLAAPASPTP
jgi:RNA polymerase sigma-70 factor, ECF subfamily